MKTSTHTKAVRRRDELSRPAIAIFWVVVLSIVWLFGAWTGHTSATKEANYYWDQHMSEAHHEH
jgi:uncharacterized membrane protein SpoIIM required for sporulation